MTRNISVLNSPQLPKAIGPIDPEDPGEDAPDLAEGVYKVANSWGTQGLTPYLLHFHSEHVIISETPTVWQLRTARRTPFNNIGYRTRHHNWIGLTQPLCRRGLKPRLRCVVPKLSWKNA